MFHRGGEMKRQALGSCSLASVVRKQRDACWCRLASSFYSPSRISATGWHHTQRGSFFFSQHFWKCPRRRVQSCVVMVILRLVKLRMKITHHNIAAKLSWFSMCFTPNLVLNDCFYQSDPCARDYIPDR